MADLLAGVDLGGTKIQSVVMSGHEVVGQARLSTPRTNPDDVVSEVAQSVVLAVQDAGGQRSDLLAIGIGSPGAVDAETGQVSKAPNIPGFMEEVALGSGVQRALGSEDSARIVVENDVTAAVIGELRLGAGRRYGNFLGVFAGSGVGGGLVLGGTIWRGQGYAGEIGHTTVHPGGRECGCGRLGCLEAYAGRIRIEMRARHLADKGRKTKLFEIMEKKGRDRVTSSVIADALEQEDKLTVELMQEAVEALGIALANAQNLLDLEAMILGGGLADRLGKPFARRVEEEMTKNLLVPERPPAVVVSELGDLSGAVGAALLAGEKVAPGSV